jgi:glycosyltransferase involved in cell wall biosynthesis
MTRLLGWPSTGCPFPGAEAPLGLPVIETRLGLKNANAATDVVGAPSQVAGLVVGRRYPRVAVDGGLYSRTYFGGAIRYLTGLGEGLVSAGAHVTLVMADPPRPPVLHLPRGATLVATVPAGVDVWLTDDPAAVAAAPQSCRTALIVHDIMQWEPDICVPRESAHGDSLDELKTALRRADVIVTVSQTTRAKVLDLFPRLDAATLVVIPHAASLPTLGVPMGVRSDVILHVGARDGYKRFDLLLKAFAAFGELHRATLVTVGGRKRLSDAERGLVERLGLGGRVRSLGYVSDAELASWYAKARVVVVPSDAEGFGVPLLEALAAGTPIVAAALAVVEEVTAGTAYVFRPGDAADAAAALTRAWSDPLSSLLAPRAERARSWTWADAGGLLLQSVLGVGPAEPSTGELG